MRDVKETGEFKTYGERTDLAYRTYASLYLDIIEDNAQKFFIRGFDGRPIEDCAEKDYEEAYIKACIELTKTGIENKAWSCADELYAAYPLLKEYANEFTFT